MRYEEVINDPNPQFDGDLIPCLKPIIKQNIDAQQEDNIIQFEFDASISILILHKM